MPVARSNFIRDIGGPCVKPTLAPCLRTLGIYTTYVYMHSKPNVLELWRLQLQWPASSRLKLYESKVVGGMAGRGFLTVAGPATPIQRSN